MYVFKDLERMKELEKLGFKNVVGAYTKLIKDDSSVFSFIQISNKGCIKKYIEENGHLKGYNVESNDIIDLLEADLVTYLEI